MKKLAIALSAVIAMAGSAFAADLPARAPVVKAPAMVAAASWTGFYVYGGVGYGLWAADTSTVNPTTGACDLCVNQIQGGKGWLATAGVGFDYQVTARIVGGVFVDADLSSIKGTLQDQSTFFAGETNQNWSGAAGVRVGWLLTPQVMSYFNGGYTRTHFGSATMLDTRIGSLLNPTGFSTPAFSKNGWFMGGGVETMFAPGWYWRSEYRYAYYGSTTLTDTCPAASCVGGFAAGPIAVDSIRFKPTVQTVRSEIVYKFNWGGGVTPVADAGWPGAASIMPTKGPALVVARSWSGVYVNAGWGYGLWAADTQTINPGTGAPISTSQRQGGKGWLGTAGVGADYQATERVVIGVFGDYDFASIKGSIQDQNPFGVADATLNSAWSAGARVGWLATPQVMTYVNGGYTQAHFKGGLGTLTTTGAPYLPVASYAGFTAGGYFVGGGVETMFMPNWFWRNEYRLAKYDSHDFVSCGAAGCGALAGHATIRFNPTVQTVRSEVVYKFNWMH